MLNSKYLEQCCRGDSNSQILEFQEYNEPVALDKNMPYESIK